MIVVWKIQDKMDLTNGNILKAEKQVNKTRYLKQIL